MQVIGAASVIVLKAFFAEALLKSNSLIVKSFDPGARIASLGWNSRAVASYWRKIAMTTMIIMNCSTLTSRWSYRVLITGCPVWSM